MYVCDDLCGHRAVIVLFRSRISPMITAPRLLSAQISTVPCTNQSAPLHLLHKANRATTVHLHPVVFHAALMFCRLKLLDADPCLADDTNFDAHVPRSPIQSLRAQASAITAAPSRVVPLVPDPALLSRPPCAKARSSQCELRPMASLMHSSSLLSAPRFPNPFNKYV